MSDIPRCGCGEVLLPPADGTIGGLFCPRHWPEKFRIRKPNHEADWQREIDRDIDWLLSHPNGVMGAKYHDAGRCWELIEGFRRRLSAYEKGIE